MDDLSAPLGQDKPRVRRRFALAAIVPRACLAVLSLSVVVFAGWAMIAENPFGGEPFVVVPANLRTDVVVQAPDAGTKPADADTAGPANAAAAGTAQPAPPAGKTVTIIDGTSGKRQDVVIPNTREDKSAAPNDRLTEQSRHGLLPKVAEDGARPSEAYARPVKAIPGKPNAPRVAIVIGGLGIGAAGTNDALSKLPGAVTFAFSPYGGDLERQVARARAGGHELLLQVPMEPHDYPDNDPGPQTLLTSLDAGQNVDRLHVLMARMQGYVGITNVMGARFAASEQALAAVLRETAKRGLIYVDDGAAARSLASQIAGANNLAFAKADAVLDAVANAADIDRALARLEVVARDRGVAVGMASAMPISIERIARWAKAAEARGVLLVPITAAVAKAKSS